LIIRAAEAEAALAEGVVALAAEEAVVAVVLAVVPAKNLPYTRNIKLID
jgi:hypothetical protein